MPFVVLVSLVLFSFVLLYWAADRARTIAVLRVSCGKVRIVRGRLPADALADIVDVVERNQLAEGAIVIRVEDQRATVRFRKIEHKNAQQQLRNVVGRFPLKRLRG